MNDGLPITFFEITTAAAFLAFSRHPADALVLEVGLGGKYDATNVIARPRMTVITPVGLDHQEFLGTSIADIAAEKAGIIKPGVPVIVGPQEDIPGDVISRRADALSAPLYAFGQDFFARSGTRPPRLSGHRGLLDLPLPRLVGRHQIENAAVAIAALRRRGGWGRDDAIERGLRTVEWPARLQRLSRGPLIDAAPKGAEVWLDGGHNPHGGAAIARAMADFEERAEKPLYLICGMLKTKDAAGFLSAFRGLARHVTTVPIEGEAASLGAGGSLRCRAPSRARCEPGGRSRRRDDAGGGMVACAARRRAAANPHLRLAVSGGCCAGGKRLNGFRTPEIVRDRSFDPFLDFGFRQRADFRGRDLALMEDHQRGNAAHAVFGRDVRDSRRY